MSKFIIIEGPDRVGKDTQQNLIIKNFPNLAFHKVHYSSVPFDGEQGIEYSAKMYNDMFKMMMSCKDNDVNIIFNRSHLGESVYSALYRGYNGDYIFDIEDKYVNALRKNLYLITLVNDAKIIYKRDDGKSFYKFEEEVKAEVDGFKRAHKKSKIKNKLMMNVGTMSADEISFIIKDFINNDSWHPDIDNQLKLEI